MDVGQLLTNAAQDVPLYPLTHAQVPGAVHDPWPLQGLVHRPLLSKAMQPPHTGWEHWEPMYHPEAHVEQRAESVMVFEQEHRSL